MTEITLSRRKIRTNTLMLLSLGFIVSCLLGWMVYTSILDKYTDNTVQLQQRQLAQAQLIFSHKIGDMSHAIQLIHDAPSLLKALAVDSEINRELAQQLFISSIHTFESLMQVRWLDQNGQEQVRVDGKQGKAFIIPQDLLQNKKERYYFSEGIKAPQGQVYLSPLDLNIEHGKIETPYRPTIRITLRTGSEHDSKPGLLVLNYDIGPLLNTMKQLNTDGIKLQLVDENGFWMLHPKEDLEWGRDLHNVENNIQRINPDIWTALHTESTHNNAEVKSGLISYECTDLTQGYSNTDFTSNSQLCFIAATPRNIINTYQWEAAIPALFVTLFLFVSGCWILAREQKTGMELINLSRQLSDDKKQLAHDKQLLKESADQTQNLLKQQQILQDNLVESEKLSALGMMVAGVAHELNTPLGAAIMASSTIRMEHEQLAESFHSGLTKDAFQNYLNTTKTGLDLVESNQKRAAELVKTFKRLAIDRAREEIITFHLRQVVDDLMKTLHHRLKVTRVSVSIDIADIEMVGTPGAISQVVQNLVMNALQHAFEPEHGGSLTITATEHEDIVEIKVIDNGKGIDPKLLPKQIFEPFVTSKRSNGNTGLGMHFVHQWVTKTLQGTIEVDSTLNKGSTFIIRIPKCIRLSLPED